MKICKSLNKKIASEIRLGKIAIIPTDTIYGIVAVANDENAVNRVYDIKNRDKTKPFIILISDISDLEKFSISLSINMISQLSTYWPGPNSLILQCDNPKFDYLTRGRTALAFRLPDDKPLREFIRKTGPLVAPSANPEGGLPAVDIESAIKYFDKKIDIYVDAGKINNLPSHLIDLSGGTPIIYR